MLCQFSLFSVYSVKDDHVPPSSGGTLAGRQKRQRVEDAFQQLLQVYSLGHHIPRAHVSYSTKHSSLKVL